MKRHRRQRRLIGYAGWALVILWGLALLPPQGASAEGSRNIWSRGEAGYRASLEWRNSVYGPQSFNLKRRTLLRVYAEQGEYLLMGSTAVGVNGTPNKGDIWIYNPGVVTGSVGSALIPPLTGPLGDPARPGAFANGFSCVAQRQVADNGSRGRIVNREQELQGPNTEDNDIPAGYRPCFYQAPASGIYDVVFLGPRGDNSDSETAPRGLIDWEADNPRDAGPEQDTAVTAWDLTVRASLNEPAEKLGRLFTYYFTGFTGDTGRTIDSTVYVVTNDGYIYEVEFDTDPFGFLFYANQKGFEDSDGTPLYHNVVSDPSLPFEQQNQLYILQGGVRLQTPQFPILFNEPDPALLEELGIPALPQQPNIVDLSFTGPAGGATTTPGQGGTFSFRADHSGIYTLIISRDGQSFDPTDEANRVLRGLIDGPGTVSVPWNGLDNAGSPFEAGETYYARMVLQGGEIHFPFFDVENNPNGGPRIRLINPPDRTGDGVGDCPPWQGECRGAFYDDRGYRTVSNEIVGTRVNGPLCLDNVGNPPDPLASDPLQGFDTGSAQRRFGFLSGGNPAMVCDPAGGFGDKKGLDLWTFYPSNALITPFEIVEPTAVTLARLSATQEQGRNVVEWATSDERDSWGFHLYRGASTQRTQAQRITAQLIPARGLGGGGSAYRWEDTGAAMGQHYYWLEEVARNGARQEYGPVRAKAAADGPFSLWLALALR